MEGFGLEQRVRLIADAFLLPPRDGLRDGEAVLPRVADIAEPQRLRRDHRAAYNPSWPSRQQATGQRR